MKSFARVSVRGILPSTLDETLCKCAGQRGTRVISPVMVRVNTASIVGAGVFRERHPGDRLVSNDQQRAIEGETSARLITHVRYQRQKLPEEVGAYPLTKDIQPLDE